MSDILDLLDQGTLTVTVIDGHDILAVDRGGMELSLEFESWWNADIDVLATRSDPYAVFTLNGIKVHKTETHKKTVNPVWNEEFEVNIVSS